MEEVFNPTTENQKQSQNQTKQEAEKQIRDSTQTTTQVTETQTRAINVCWNNLMIFGLLRMVRLGKSEYYCDK